MTSTASATTTLSSTIIPGASSNNSQDQLSLEKDINKELLKKIENLKSEKDEENEKYRTLAQAFEDLYAAHAEILKKQENLLTTDGITMPFEQKNELLVEYDHQVDLMKQIRTRSGLDVVVNKSRGRRTSSLDGYIPGSALLRTSGGTGQRLSGRFSKVSVDEGSSGMRLSNRLSTLSISESEEGSTSQAVSRAPSSEPPKRRLSLLQGIQKTIILNLSSSNEETTEVSNHLDDSHQSSSSLPSNLTHIFGGSQRGSSILHLDESHLKSLQPAVVPLFEHFLVIGVSVDAAFSVSEQLIQKQTKLSQRLMNKLSGFFRTSNVNSRNRSASQLSTNAGEESDSFFATSGTTTTGATSAAPSRGIFSRMLSRDEVTETPNRSSIERRPSGNSWTSSLFSRISSSGPASSAPLPSSSPTSENGKDISSQSSDSDQSTPKGPPSPPNAVLGQGSKSEHATFTTPEILYRYPDDVDPPPPEVCDFCMPSGGKLRHLQPQDSETSILEIMYGHGQNQRNSRCFIFILEDKTLDLKQNPEDCESGINTGRTYGICVVHPRLLNPKYPNGYSKEEFLDQNQNQTSSDASPVLPPIEFEAGVIFNMITYERMMRMEKLDPNTSMTDKHVYEYIPTSIYRDVLDKLSLVSPPLFNSTLNFKFSPTVAPISYLRLSPTAGTPEHILRAAEWALPPLVRWLNPKIIVWALGLLMCEVKLIVIGVDPATVSCAVIGLTSLLKPLHWVSPMIPIMPLKHIEFLESPVPLVAGMVVDGDHATPETLAGESISPYNILKLCDDGESVTAVLDLSARDIFVLNSHSEVAPELVFPHAEDLIQDIQTVLFNYTSDPLDPQYDSSYNHITGSVRRENKPHFNITVDDMAACKAIQELVYNHLTMVAQAAKEVASEVLKEQMEAVEQRVKANLEKIEKFKHSTPYRTSLASLHEGEERTSHEEEVMEENETNQSSNNDSINRLVVDSVETSSLLPPIPERPSPVATPKSITPQASFNRSTSMPTPTSSSIIVGGGNVIPIVSLQSLFIDTTETKQLFLRRFVTTQMFTEYDQEIMDILQDMNFVNDKLDDGYSRLPGAIQSSAASASRKSTSAGKGMATIGGRAHGRSRSLYFSGADIK